MTIDFFWSNLAACMISSGSDIVLHLPIPRQGHISLEQDFSFHSSFIFALQEINFRQFNLDIHVLVNYLYIFCQKCTLPANFMIRPSFLRFFRKSPALLQEVSCTENLDKFINKKMKWNFWKLNSFLLLSLWFRMTPKWYSNFSRFGEKIWFLGVI